MLWGNWDRTSTCFISKREHQSSQYCAYDSVGDHPGCDKNQIKKKYRSVTLTRTYPTSNSVRPKYPNTESELRSRGITTVAETPKKPSTPRVGKDGDSSWDMIKTIPDLHMWSWCIIVQESLRVENQSVFAIVFGIRLTPWIFSHLAISMALSDNSKIRMLEEPVEIAIKPAPNTRRMINSLRRIWHLRSLWQPSVSELRYHISWYPSRRAWSLN